MAETPTPRLGLPHWSAGTDTYPGREGWNRILDIIDDNTAIVLTAGPSSNRPQAGQYGRFYLATNESVSTGGRLYFDNGSSWVELNTNGDGGVGRPLTIGTNGTEGTSPRSARADHTHPVPLATSTVDGLMPRGLADMLQKSTSVYNGTAVHTLMVRNHRGATQVNDPMDGYDAANKRWVESTPGTWDKLANTLARRGADGTFYVSEPTKPDAVSTKRYTDTKASRAVWKCNWRPAPYGLPEILSVDTGLYDYRDTDEVPASARGTTDVLGSTVENIAETMPLLAVAGQDGAPERINDRELIWPVIRAVQELSVAHDDALEENTVLRARVKSLERKAKAMESELGAIKHHLGL